MRLVGCLAFYSALATWATWPLASFAGSEVVGSPIAFDSLLILWILRWDMHALATKPLHLFEANAFHPTSLVLATTEHLLGLLPVFAPVWWLTDNPVLGLNLLILTSFLLCGVLTHLLVRRWTGSSVAGLVAGVSFALAPWRLPDGLNRPHLLQLQYLPLILLGLDRIARGGGTGVALLTAGALLLQCLCSYYLAYPAYLLAGAFVLADVVGNGVRGRAAPLARFGVALLGPLLVLLPTSWPYVRQSSTGQMVVPEPLPNLVETIRSLGHPLLFSTRVCVGWITAGLALVALARLPALWKRDRPSAVRVLALGLAGSVALALSAGPFPLVGDSVAPWLWLKDLVPGLGRMHAPIRFAYLTSFAASVLAGYCIALLWSTKVLRRSGGRILRSCFAGAVLLSLLLPVARLPAVVGLPVEVTGRVPEVYRWLAGHGEGQPLLELPIRTALDNARAMYFSTFHWLPLVNGHTGYYPPSYRPLRELALALPDPEALDRLASCTGIRWILVHGPVPRGLAAWKRLNGVSLRKTFPRPDWLRVDHLFEVRRQPRPPCPDDVIPAHSSTIEVESDV